MTCVHSNKQCIMVFLDFPKTYERVVRKAFFETLRRCKVSEHFAQETSKLYVDRTVKLCIDTSETKVIPYPHGVTQGYSL